VLTDIRMPPTGTDEGIQVARALRTTHPEIGVVVLSQFADPEYVLALLESGSGGRAYLLKERVNDPRELASAIKAVASGGSAVDSKVIEVLVQAHANDATSPLRDLTPREREVLAELAQGKSNGAIAESLVLTKRAVEKHINAIFMKLNLAAPDDVSRRVKAVVFYLAREDDHSPDAAATMAGIRASMRVPWPCALCTMNVPPVASTRSRSPCSPRSLRSTAPPTPSSSTWSTSTESSMKARTVTDDASAYRWALVTASRTM
jgi:DNA-binding NarL/FixJ family response regulator